MENTPKFVFVDFGGTADLVISEMAFVHYFHPNEEGFENPEYRQKLEQWMAENNVASLSYDSAKNEQSDNEASGMIDCPILDLSDTQRSVTVHFKEKEAEGLKGVDLLLRRFAHEAHFDNAEVRARFAALVEKHAEGQEAIFPSLEEFYSSCLISLECMIEEELLDDIPCDASSTCFTSVAVSLGFSPEQFSYGTDDDEQVIEDIAEFAHYITNLEYVHVA